MTSAFFSLPLVFTSALFTSAADAAEQMPEDILTRGAYLTRTAGCADCHTVELDHPYAGGLRVATPVGVFVTPNISPDPESGIGKWTEAQFKTALREGESPTGLSYYPIFPYRSYGKMTDLDIAAIYSYLQAQKPIYRPNESHSPLFLNGGLSRAPLTIWKWLAIGTISKDPNARIRAGGGPFQPDPLRADSWNRGAYLAEAFMHCAECHTPRGLLTQIPNRSVWMSGGTVPLEAIYPPNITPDRATGIGDWTNQDWERFLSGSGETPQFATNGAAHVVRAEMAQVVRNAAALTPADRAAVIEYMRSLPAIENSRRRP